MALSTIVSAAGEEKPWQQGKELSGPETRGTVVTRMRPVDG